MFRIFRPSARIRPKKYHNFWQISIVVRYIVIIACLALLPLNEYIYDVVDDFTPAYPSNTATTQTEASTTHTTETPVSSTTSNTTTSTTTPVPSTTNSTTPKPSNGTSKEKAVEEEAAHTTPVVPDVERLVRYTDSNDSSSKTRLSDLLILYPCFTTILIILGMEMCAQMLLDPMTKCTNLFLILLCIGLSILAFVISLLAALRTSQLIMIIIATLSVVFLILETIDLCCVCKSQ